MLAILTAPQLWIGLMLMLGVWVFLGRGDTKKSGERLARATRKAAPTKTSTDPSQSLRKHVTGEDTAFGKVLGGMSSISKLRARFEVAGVNTTPQKFIFTMVGIGLGTLFVISVILGKPILVGLLMGLVLGLGIPHISLSRKIKKRHKNFLKLFPDAIDLMVRGLRAGLPIGESFITVSKELPAPMGDVFAGVAQQTALGVPMEKSLADTAKKLDITEFNFFVTSIILQRETGGNLGEILSNLAEMLRARHMMKLKIGALSSEARASAYIVGALPFVVMLMLQVISPEYLRPLFHDYRGNIWLLIAAGSMSMGGFIMAKMTQLEI
jgi:tight adherence protein B